MWMSSVYSGINIFSESFALGIKLTNVQSASTWTLVNIYGPCNGTGRMAFTSWLSELEIPDGEDWLLVADFNYICAPDNRNKSGGDANDILVFNDIIRSLSLVELPIKGGAFTWSNMQTNPLLEQLDWHYTSANWAATYPNTLVMPLGKPVSDPIPCYVSNDSAIRSTRCGSAPPRVRQRGGRP